MAAQPASRRGTLYLIAIALFALGATSAVAPLSSAEPGGQPASPPDGDRLAQLKSYDEVRDAGAAVDHYKAPGYGKVVLDLDNRVVQVFWKGTPPKAVLAQLGAHANGVTVTLAQAVYSDAELAQAGEKLLAAGREKGAVPISGVSRTQDMSGLIAEIAPADLKTAGAATLHAAMTKSAGVPVSTAEGLGVTPTTRQNDSPPWQGGGAMRWPAVPTAYCTTGFAMLTSSGEGRLLSAGHCDTTGNREIRDGSNSATTGVITPGGAAVDIRLADIDSMIIDPSASPATIGKVFGGAFNQASGTTNYEYHVGGSGSPSEGDVVCLSGANSGEHCNKPILETGFQFNCPGDSSLSCSGFRYGNTASGITVAQGDSGGPIYVERSDGRVGARGIQSGGMTSSVVTCPAVADNNPPVLCFRVAVGVSINRIIDWWSDHGHAGLFVEFD